MLTGLCIPPKLIPELQHKAEGRPMLLERLKANAYNLLVPLVQYDFDMGEYCKRETYNSRWQGRAKYIDGHPVRGRQNIQCMD